jgi:hypothetical protein
MDEFEQIVNGWKNLIFKNPASEEVGKKRLAICLSCIHRKKITNRCGVCHCFIPAAVRSSNKRCLKGKW